MVNSTNDDERRRARRFRVGWDVAVKGTDPTGLAFNETGMLENLSSIGGLLYLATALSVGARLELRIKMPLKNNKWMRYSAEVVRVTNHKLNGIAVRFETARPRFIEG
jgi:PilZ domain-containing protein